MSRPPPGHARPWYRQFWPWFLIAIPLAGVVMATITGLVAIRYADVEVRDPATPEPLSKTSWKTTERAQ